MPTTYFGVQILRGFAALLVVLTHSAQVFAQKTGYRLEFPAGESGVDVFFAISGFVMVVVTAKSWGQPSIAGSFFARRVNRIVPLYWGVTFLKCGLMLLLPALIVNTELSAEHLVSSLLFVPAYQYPILQVGWTLNFEMLFYVLFAVALRLTSRPVVWLSAVLVSLALLGVLVGRNWGIFSILVSPMLIEFVFGMMIGMATVNGMRLPRRMAIALAVISAAALLISNVGGNAGSFRVWIWGVPGALLLASIVSLEDSFRARRMGTLIKLGDASYSLYLIHSLVIGAVWAVMMKFVPVNGFSGAAISLLAILICMTIARAIYVIFERPLTDYGSKRLASRRSAVIA